MSIVIFLIAASQVQTVINATPVLAYPAIAFIGYLIIAAGLSKILSGITRLPSGQGRVLAFSFGSRNSFVVLPIALALPKSYEVAVIVIVMQSLIELFGMAAFVWLIPNKLFRFDL